MIPRAVLILIATTLFQPSLSAQPAKPLTGDQQQAAQAAARMIALLQDELAQTKKLAAQAIAEAQQAKEEAVKQRQIADQTRRELAVQRDRIEEALNNARKQKLLAEEARAEALQEAGRSREQEAKARKLAEMARRDAEAAFQKAKLELDRNRKNPGKKGRKRGRKARRSIQLKSIVREINNLKQQMEELRKALGTRKYREKTSERQALTERERAEKLRQDIILLRDQLNRSEEAAKAAKGETERKNQDK